MQKPLEHVRRSLTVFAAVTLGGCVPLRPYHTEPNAYAAAIPTEAGGVAADLAVIEFDDHGVLWDHAQLDAALDLVRRRNAEHPGGVLVLIYMHGWKNNADPEDPRGSFARFRQTVADNAAAQAAAGPVRAGHVVGVFLGWRGNSVDMPVLEQLTFWDRHRTAERIASLAMRETLLRLTVAAAEHRASKCFVVGHSMGGLIMGRTLWPAVTTLLLANGPAGTRLAPDLVLLQNPALDALSSWQFIDFLKRSRARAELRTADGRVTSAPGPVIASITSEADDATGGAYPVGRAAANLLTAFRRDHAPGEPSQRHLATHTEGHVAYLVSHTAQVRDGQIVVEPVPGAFNDTPFWIIRASREISRDHGDVNNPLYGRLVEHLLDLNQVYRTDLDTWLVTDPEPKAAADRNP